MEERRSKINYYLDIAQTVTERGTCLRRRFGAIIVKDDVIVSTGYAGAPRGRKNCCDLGFCLREQMNIPRGERYELCRSVHAEANAIISAARGNIFNAGVRVHKPVRRVFGDLGRLFAPVAGGKQKAGKGKKQRNEFFHFQYPILPRLSSFSTQSATL